MQLITVHGRTRCQFYKGAADWARGPRREGGGRPSRSSSTATSTASTRAVEALAQSGADAVMVGRGAQGRPWFPGQLAHYLATGEREGRSAARDAARDSSRELYEEMLCITARASACAMRASISAGRSTRLPQTAGAPPSSCKSARAHVLTVRAIRPRRSAGSPQPIDGFRLEGRGMNRAEPPSRHSPTRPPTPCSTRCRIRS